MKNKKPILIIGAHRSGSTWVGKMLSLASGVDYISEPFNPKTGLVICKNWFEYINHKNEDKYLTEMTRMIQFRGRYHFHLSALRYWLLGLVPGIRPLIKDPIASMSSDWLANTFEMSTVVVFRHPAAFYNSLRRMGWRFDFNNFLKQDDLMRDYLSELRPLIEKPNKTFVEEASILWLCIYTVLDKYIIKNKNWIVKRHEDLSANPICDFKELYKQLDLEWTPKIEKQIRKVTGSNNLSEILDGKAHHTKRDSRGIINAWKAKVSPDEIKTIESICGKLAKKYHYNFL
jgi:hypothetical protein